MTHLSTALLRAGFNLSTSEEVLLIPHTCRTQLWWNDSGPEWGTVAGLFVQEPFAWAATFVYSEGAACMGFVPA